MKISDNQNVGPPPAAGGVASGGSNAPARPAPAHQVTPDHVTIDRTAGFDDSVSNGVKIAAGDRAVRLRSLVQAVRSGAYRPSASQLADQILAAAELDAHLAKSVR
jgi:hypothetical protein